METISTKQESREPHSSTSSLLISTPTQTSLIRKPSINVAQQSQASNELFNHRTSNDIDDSEFLTKFFSEELYNSECDYTDDLFKRIEKSQNGSLARQTLALYQNRYARLDKPWNNVTFMYGLGLIYMHFNAYNWAVRAFRDTIYMQPNFPRARDVHTRLGLIFKSNGRYKLSEKHFKLAIGDNRPCSGSCTNYELRFHLANLLERQGKSNEAEDMYERLLKETNLPNQLSANIQRQLGCIYCNDYNNPSTNPNSNRNFKDPSDNSQKINAALSHFSSSNKIVSDPKTSYYLGRCLTNIGKHHDAFVSYKSVIDKEESTSDIWCSIGVLYHRQNQLMEAQKAYIRAVQNDKDHETAWLNLGLLYEDHKQYNDAIKCFKHAQRSNSKQNDSIINRIRFMQDQMKEVDRSLAQQHLKPHGDKLISLEDLWNTEGKLNNDRRSRFVNNTLGDVATFGRSIDVTYDDLNNKTKNGHFTSLTKDHNSISSHHITNHKLAKEVIEPCNTISDRNNRRIDINLLSDDLQPPRYFPKCPPYPPVPDSKLFPSTPSVFLETKKDIASMKLNEYCQLGPISILRNLATVLKLDLGLFSTKTLLESNPNQQILVTEHSLQRTNDDEKAINSSSASGINSWACDAVKSKYSIGRYASYQVASFRESLQEEGDSKQGKSKTSISIIKQDTNESESNEFPTQLAKRLNSNNSNSNNNSNFNINNHNPNNFNLNNIHSSNPTHVDSPGFNSNNNHGGTPIDSYHNTSNDHKASPTSNSSPFKRFKKEPVNSSFKRVVSAEDIDISDEKLWRPQLNELNKLPGFIKCVSASNLLTHIGALVPGVNTASMGMHVPGSRILKHVRPNNLCGVNINVGPGDYEWCAVSIEYSSIIAKLCNKNGFELEDDSWWPSINDLLKHNIPIFRFSQRPGDLVWVNAGTITWVQATGWCNNISWNVGPLSGTQYRLVAERFELNKLLYYRSAVPMIQLTWNIIMNIQIILDDKLHDHIVAILRRSLQYCARVKAMIERGGDGSNNRTSTPTKMIDAINSDDKGDSKQTKNDDIGSFSNPDEEMHNPDHEANDIEPKTPTPKLGKLCSLCECEVFNIHLIGIEDKLVYCFECARRIEPNMIENKFTVIEEYELKYLMKLYDHFIDLRKRYDAKKIQKDQQQPQQDQGQQS